ncbi:hypothetical protein [Streptomyces sp. ODS28]|uniref:hypothetical protein n=1 Tax=Streptomyces sp. ODS28 TaxID=3136688 RepID=UPI0031EBC516
MTRTEAAAREGGGTWEESTSEALAYLRATLRERGGRGRLRDRATTLYTLALVAVFLGVPYLASAARSAPDGPWRRGIAEHTLAVLPSAAPLLLLTLLYAALRNARWQGPVAVDAATASWALPQPLLRERLLRPRLLTAGALWGGLGAVAGAVCGFLLSTQGNGARPATTAAGAWACGTVLLLAAACATLAQRYERTVPRAFALLLAGLYAVLLTGAFVPWTPSWSTGLVLCSGPWGWAAQPLAAAAGAPGIWSATWPYAVVLQLVAVAVAARAAWRAAPYIPAPVLARSARIRRTLAASLVTLELRQARSALPGPLHRGARLRLPVPASPRLLVPWRDLTALLRAPARPVRALFWLAAALALTAAAPAPAPRTGALCAVLAPAAAYLAAAQLAEPARLDADDPRRAAALPYTRGALALRHTAVPGALLLAGLAGGAAALAAAGLWHPALLALCCCAPALLGAALVSAYRGSMPPRVAIGTETPLGNTAPAQMAAWYARGPLTALACATPALLATLHAGAPLLPVCLWLLAAGAGLLWWGWRRAGR